MPLAVKEKLCLALEKGEKEEKMKTVVQESEYIAVSVWCVCLCLHNIFLFSSPLTSKWDYTTLNIVLFSEEEKERGGGGKDPQ